MTQGKKKFSEEPKTFTLIAEKSSDGTVRTASHGSSFSDWDILAVLQLELSRVTDLINSRRKEKEEGDKNE